MKKLFWGLVLLLLAISPKCFAGVSLGTIEYAYAEAIYMTINEPYVEQVLDEDNKPTGETVTKYKHTIGVLYSLQDSNKQELKKQRMFHTINDLSDMDTVEEIIQELSTNLETWILADKQELSGYEPN